MSRGKEYPDTWIFISARDPMKNKIVHQQELTLFISLLYRMISSVPMNDEQELLIMRTMEDIAGVHHSHTSNIKQIVHNGA